MLDDARFSRRTAALRVTGRLLALGALAGMALGLFVWLVAAVCLPNPAGAAGSVAGFIGLAPLVALVGLVAGTAANAVNAVLTAVALRLRPTAVARWVIVPLPVAAAMGTATILSNAPYFAWYFVVSGVGALAVAIWLGPWCLAPAAATGR